MDPDAYLDSLEPVGWRLGLERMHKLTTALGLPQHRFASIHVVGTNGKSSVTRMTAALLEAHGLRAGAVVSPHSDRWAQRTLIGGREVAETAWAEAVEQVARAAEGVDQTLEEGEAVTQFEAATAASFVALAAARVEVAVVEAGLGGRLDATNTIPSKVTVLTSIGLDHTEWLGETETEIAAEKLAVLRDQTTLVLGEVSPEVAELAERTARERAAEVVVVGSEPVPAVRLRASGGFQKRNFALACAAAEAFLGRPLDRDLVARVAATIRVPGRLEQIAESPPTYLDAAHNPAGAAALAESLPAVSGGRGWSPASRFWPTRTPGRWSRPWHRPWTASSAPSCPPRPWKVTAAPAPAPVRPPSWSRSASRSACGRRRSPSSDRPSGTPARWRSSRPKASSSSPVPTMQSLRRGRSSAPDCARIRPWIALAAPAPNCSR